MDNAQVTEYIRSQLAQGHTEADIRNHLLAYGWQQQAVDAAFAQYHSVSTARPTEADAAGKHSKRKWAVSAVVILAAIVLVAVKFLASSPQTLDKLATPALQSHAQMVSEENDANKLIAAVSEYQANNNGGLPATTAVGTAAQSLELCGQACDEASSSVALEYFQAKNVHIKSYAADLQIHDVQALYLIAGGTCNQDANGMAGPASSQRAMVALYATSDHKQHCLSQ